MADIKIFVCCHCPVPVPKHPLLVPLQVGAALADSRFPGFLQDNVGNHIPEKNRSYCGLTGHYWAWKNVSVDYYGFFHYRRYLYPHVGAPWPYRIEKEPTLPLLEKLGYKDFRDQIERHDLVIPLGEDMGLSVRDHYSTSPFHHGLDLALSETIVLEQRPEMVAALEQYLSGAICYFGNIFVMRRQLFQDYCSWLFSVLEEFDRRGTMENYGPQERRVNGYLAERLLGLYVTWLRSQGNCSILELPRVHFIPQRAQRWKKQLINAIIPPGTRRRRQVKVFLGLNTFV